MASKRDTLTDTVNGALINRLEPCRYFHKQTFRTCGRPSQFLVVNTADVCVEPMPSVRVCGRHLAEAIKDTTRPSAPDVVVRPDH